MILSIVQARISSTRLPGKVLMPIADKPILKWVVDALPEPKIVSTSALDTEIIEWCRDNNIAVFGGPLSDVLKRFYLTWEYAKPKTDWILRVCADCPMLTRRVVLAFLRRVGLKSFDTIYTNRPYDPDGADMELFSTTALEMAHKNATDPYDREHVTPWIYRHFNVQRSSILGRPLGPENPEEKCSVDTEEDYLKVKNLMEAAQCTSE
jgi:spore coat polysaccharide biosynthesis protein SpsF